MPKLLNIVAVSGNTFHPSRTLALVEAIVAGLGERLPSQRHTVALAEIARGLGAALARDELSPEVEQRLQRIEAADLLVVGVPVYRGAYPGLLKHLFDLVRLDALVDVPVLLAATGGSERHALVLEHQLRPLFGFFQSLTLPIGVYATESDFKDHRIVSQPLRERIALAVDRASGLLGGGFQALRRIA